jgi:DNA-directed RNA polymerase specialized sigma subunit
LFAKDSGSRYGRRNLCKECSNKKNREDTKATQYKHKHQLAKRYHITPEEYVECMSTSNCCEICSSTDNLCYDHDHNTMKFRGVLCRSCNKAIGLLGDTVEGLQKAVDYLERN